jgi:hypothetical protein
MNTSPLATATTDQSMEFVHPSGIGRIMLNSSSVPPMIYRKMSEVMREIGAIGKDQKNAAQGFKFRGIDQFVNALYPALTRHGVFMAPKALNHVQELKEVIRSNGKSGVDKHVAIMMEYTFYAEDGSNVTVGPIPAEGLDSGDKATNKALSAALKYALIQTFSIPTEDMAEADLESPEIGRVVSKQEDVPVLAQSVSVSAATQEPVTSNSIQSPASKKTSSFRKPSAKTNSSENEKQDKTMSDVLTKLQQQDGGWE